MASTSREGCFVYQFIGEASSIGVRNERTTSKEARTEVAIKKREMVSVDLIRPSRITGSTNGPFLRLSDGSGWLFEKKRGEPMMKRIPMTEGLWCLYVDNGRTGIALRRHPIDRSDLKSEDGVTYEPMQKIYCDRKVKHPDTGVHFYRVQGTEGWVFDRRPAAGENDYERIMLLDELKVQTGLFVYEHVDANRISIRSKPDTGEDSRTVVKLEQGNLVAVDVIRQSPYSLGNGPFLRLTDGSGWIFEHKKGKCLMKSVPIREGKWSLKVLNAPAGIWLRRQPIDSKVFRDRTTTYEPGSTVQCTHMVKDSSGTKFYRVEGTEGWIFDERDGKSMLKLVSESASGDNPHFNLSSCSNSANGSSTGWSPTFVRGVAAATEGVHEIAFNEKSKLISFRTADHARINVYYATQTIGTALFQEQRNSFDVIVPPRTLSICLRTPVFIQEWATNEDATRMVLVLTAIMKTLWSRQSTGVAFWRTTRKKLATRCWK